MKKILALLLFTAANTIISQGQVLNCGFDHTYQNTLKENPELAEKLIQQENELQSIIARKKRSKTTENVYTIPVVVHVIHLGEAEGVGNNISDAQINSAITQLNNGFRNTHGQSLDTKIQFQLATKDENCNSTTGIVRVDGSGVSNYSTQGITDANASAVKALSYWSNSNYYNIWVVTEIDDNNGGGGTQGYAQLGPSPAASDGTVIMNSAFGSLGTVKSYTDEGKVLIHEVGHALSLRHTFEGDNNGTSCPTGNQCGSGLGDCCGDTPPHIRSNSDCVVGTNSCDAGSSTELFIHNYMDYSSETCQYLFTSEQKARMRACLEGTRASLLYSNGLSNSMPAFSITAATCTGSSTSPHSGSGIMEVQIEGKMIKSSGSALTDGGYTNNANSCAGAAVLDLSTQYEFKVKVPSVNKHQVKAFIDWNNNGNLNDTGEEIYSKSSIDGAVSPYDSLNFTVPAAAATGAYLRMRVITNFGTNHGRAALVDACDNVSDGEIEDYAIYINAAVTPVPVAAFSADKTTVCVGETVTFTDASTNTPTSWSWSLPGASSTTSTAQNPSVTYSTAGTYNVTLTATNASGSDDEVKSNYITVTADRTVGAASSSPTLCVNTAMTTITHATTGVTGITSSTGLPSGVTASYAANVISISGTPTVAGTYNYTITPTSTCGSATATGSITVTADGTVSAASSTPTLCVNTAMTDITHATTGVTGITSSSGLPAGVTATYAANTITLSGTPTVAGTYNYTITPTSTCGSATATGTITVTTSATVGSASSTPSVCVNSAMTSITHITTGVTGIASSSGLPSGVTASYASNTITISGTPTATGTYNYTITPTTGCGSPTATGTITVNALPTPTLTLPIDATCINSAAVALSGGMPLGGSYAGTAVTGGNFDPTTAGAGIHVITYNYTDGNGCSNTATDNFTVNALPNTTFTLAINNVCQGSASSALSGGFPAGGNYSGTGVSSGNFDPAVAGLGTHAITYSYTDGNGCTNTATDNFTVNALPVVTLILSPDKACQGGGLITLGGGTPIGGVYTGTGVSGSNFNPSTAGLGTHTLTYTYTDGNGCVSSASDDMTVNDLPSVSVNNAEVCEFAGSATFTATAPTAVSYLWSGNGTGTSSATSGFTAGSYTVTVTDGNGCQNSATGTLTVNPLPAVSVNNASICNGAAAATFTATSATAVSYVWSNNGSGNTATTSGTTAGNYTVTVTDAKGCQNSANGTLTVNNLPVVNLGADTTLCGGANITLDAGNSGATYNWLNGAGTAQTFVASSGSVDVVVTDANGCIGRDTIILSTSNPIVNLANDTTFCGAGSLTLDAGSGFASYLWSNGATTQTVATSGAGDYSVIVTDLNGCQDFDTTSITINDPVVDLGNDTTFCGSSIHTLNAGTFASYLWSTGASSQTISVSSSGQYHVTVTDADGCQDQDTVLVSISDPVVNLANDTTFCGAGSLTLDAGSGFASYLWSNGATTQTVATSGAGDYSVIVTDLNGCQDFDTTTITINNPVVNLGNDTTFCGSSLVLNAGNFSSYSWSTGATSSVITVTSAGTYHVAVTDAAGCSDRDTIIVTIGTGTAVTINPLFPVNYTNNQTNVSLTFGQPSGGVYTGTAVTFGKFNPSAAGIGSHTIVYTYTDGGGCTSKDSLVLNVSPLTGVEELNTENLKVMPNPFTEVLNVSKTSNGEAYYSLLDASGAVILSGKMNGSITLITEQLAAGAYYLMIQTPESVATVKVIKSK